MSCNNVLYRMRDGSGVLLYVGITLDVAARMRAHRGEKAWWPEIAAIELEHFRTRDELELAEAIAIRAEAPRYNLRRHDEKLPLIGSASMDEADRVKGHNVRVDDRLWERFGQACKAAGTSRTRVIVEFLMWYCRVPGARRPERPDPE